MAGKKVSREEIESRVKEVIAKAANIDESKLKIDSHLRNDLGIDSFAAIEMVYNAEDEFGISISDDEMIKLTTISDIVDVVEKKLTK